MAHQYVVLVGTVLYVISRKDTLVYTNAGDQKKKKKKLQKEGSFSATLGFPLKYRSVLAMTG